MCPPATVNNINDDLVMQNKVTLHNFEHMQRGMLYSMSSFNQSNCIATHRTALHLGHGRRYTEADADTDTCNLWSNDKLYLTLLSAKYRYRSDRLKSYPKDHPIQESAVSFEWPPVLSSWFLTPSEEATGAKFEVRFDPAANPRPPTFEADAPSMLQLNAVSGVMESKCGISI